MTCCAQDALGGLAEELRKRRTRHGAGDATALPLLAELSDLSRCVTDMLEPSFDTAITVDPNVPAAESQPAYLDFLNSRRAAPRARRRTSTATAITCASLAGGGDELVQMPNPAPSDTGGNNILFGNEHRAGRRARSRRCPPTSAAAVRAEQGLLQVRPRPT